MPKCCGEHGTVPVCESCICKITCDCECHWKNNEPHKVNEGEEIVTPESVTKKRFDKYRKDFDVYGTSSEAKATALLAFELHDLATAIRNRTQS